MSFNSFAFLVFFSIISIVFFLVPQRYRWALLLLASCYFYMYFKPVYLLILFFIIVVDYFAGIYIEKAITKKEKKFFLVLSLIVNCGVLVFFKYFNFFSWNIAAITNYFGHPTAMPYLSFLLPLGLSFHTFQAMSYTIEVFRGNQKAEKHIGIYALYVLFYPQLIAGPIERPQNLLPQFRKKFDVHYFRIKHGLNTIVWGFFKKLVIADNIAFLIDDIFKEPGRHSGMVISAACILFTVQLYCDFSGYSEIAIGSARVLGFKLMKNFDRPLISKSLSEFWRRWHISLSSWFMDYLFTPLAVYTKKWGSYAIVFALMATFSVSGLWHGASWKFVVYGGLNGLGVVVEFMTRKVRTNISTKVYPFIFNSTGWLLTICFVSFSLIFFRSSSLKNAFLMTSRLPLAKWNIQVFSKLCSMDYIILFLALVYMPLIEYKFYTSPSLKYFMPIEKIVIAITLVLILFLGNNLHHTFIYFQF